MPSMPKLATLLALLSPGVAQATDWMPDNPIHCRTAFSAAAILTEIANPRSGQIAALRTQERVAAAAIPTMTQAARDKANAEVKAGWTGLIADQAAVLALTKACGEAQAHRPSPTEPTAPVRDMPDLPLALPKLVPDLCFAVARGTKLTAANAKTYLLAPDPAPAPSIRNRLPEVPNWFRSQANPDNIWIGVGDRPGACHILVASTTQFPAMRRTLETALLASGFRGAVDRATTKATGGLFIAPAPDGYMIVMIDAPQATLNAGHGVQGVVHVRRMDRSAFEALSRP